MSLTDEDKRWLADELERRTANLFKEKPARRWLLIERLVQIAQTMPDDDLVELVRSTEEKVKSV